MQVWSGVPFILFTVQVVKPAHKRKIPLVFVLAFELWISLRRRNQMRREVKTHEKVLCFGFIMCGVCQEIFAWDLGIKRDTIRQANKNIVLSKKIKISTVL